MKKWLVNRYLPMWAKQTVLQENKQLKRENARLEGEVKEMTAYIAGIHNGLRAKGRKAEKV